MNLPWFRMYESFAADPVIQSLAFEDQRHYVVILCLKCQGVLDRPITGTNRERVICRGLGLDPTTANEAKRRLMEVMLIDENWQPLGWSKRQFKSDDSTQRVRKYRKNKDAGNVTETLLKRDCNAPEQIKKQNRKEPPKSPNGGLPEWLNPDDWTAFKEHRRRLRKPMTPRAETLAINELARLVAKGYTATELINHAILKGWQSIYEPKGNGPAAQSWEGID